MDEVKLVVADDPYKDCRQILYSITEAEYLRNYAHRRTRLPHLYMSYPICIPIVQIDALRNQYRAEDRIDYLKTLYANKGCERKSDKTDKPKDSDRFQYRNIKVESAKLVPNN